MDTDNAILPGQLRESTFDQAMRGYHRVQVDEFVTHTRQQIHDLETRLSRALAEADQFRAAAAAPDQAGVKPAHAEVSERLSQILRLAAEEADQERAKAEQEIAASRQAADEETQHVLEQARAEYERMVTQAREESDRTLALARGESERLLTNAHEESKRLATTARHEAERLLTEAQTRSSAIHDDATRRLSQITDRHGDTVHRLSEIQDVLRELLGRDSAAGPIVDSVPAVPAPIPPSEVLGPDPLSDPLTSPLPPSTPAPAPAAPRPTPGVTVLPGVGAADEAALAEPGRHRAPGGIVDDEEGDVVDAELVEEIDLRDPPTAADGIPMLPPGTDTGQPAARK